MKILALDPAGNEFGIVGIEFNKEPQSLSIFFKYLLTAPEEFSMTQKNNYMAYSTAAIISLVKPDRVISEKPFGIGFSAQSLKELIGAIKAESWADIEWQGVSEARRTVLGDSHGGSDKKTTAEWLLQYPWSISAKKFINSQINEAIPAEKKGYDILDAILHGLCYLVANEGLIPRHKPVKEKKKKKQEKVS